MGGKAVFMLFNLGMVIRVALVSAMAAAAYASLVMLDDWVGNWVGPAWLLTGFFVPLLGGIALGARVRGGREFVAGALIGALTVALPSIGYVAGLALSDGSLTGRLDELDLPQLWAVFVPLAMAEGALMLPMGVALRTDRRRLTARE